MTGTNLATVGPATQLAPDHAADVAAASRPVLAENSITSYRAFLRKFGSWAGQHGYSTAVPVDQDVIGAWLLDLAKRGTAVSSINVALAAVRWTHEQAGKPFQRSVGLTNIMRRIRREYATTPDQAAPLKPAMLAEINTDAGQTKLGMRGSALLSLAYIFALRRGELVSIDLESSVECGAVLVMTPEAVTLTIRRSKTSQEEPETISVPREANPRAVGAIERWIRGAKITPGSALLRAISPMGTVRPDRIDADTACRAIQRRITRYLISTGMDPEAAAVTGKRYGGHSGRVGFITTAIENGARHEDVAKVSRHAPGSKMIARYSKSADQLRTAPHRITGVGF